MILTYCRQIFTQRNSAPMVPALRLLAKTRIFVRVILRHALTCQFFGTLWVNAKTTRFLPATRMPLWRSNGHVMEGVTCVFFYLKPPAIFFLPRLTSRAVFGMLKLASVSVAFGAILPLLTVAVLQGSPIFFHTPTQSHSSLTLSITPHTTRNYNKVVWGVVMYAYDVDV